MSEPASAFSRQVPAPTFASVHVEFADGTYREFHIHKPLRTEVTIASPIPELPIDGDLGALPVEIIAPSLPNVEVRMQAGLSPQHQVITIDSRADDLTGTTGKMIVLLSEAFDLLDGDGRDADWEDWKRKTGAFLRGEWR